MHGAKRVLAFCILTALLPTTLIILPLYLRHTVFADVTYRIAESDILEIRDGISSIFCEGHSLFMNTSFNAFQIQHQPEISKKRKHIRLKKSMSLPDDTMEYWGFYLLAGAQVQLTVCSRYTGSRLLVVEGERELHTCGLLDHRGNPLENNEPGAARPKVSVTFVTFETDAEVIDSGFSKHDKRNIHDLEKEMIAKNKAMNNVELDAESRLDQGGEQMEIIDDEILQLKKKGEELIQSQQKQNGPLKLVLDTDDDKIRHQKHHKLIRSRKNIPTSKDEVEVEVNNERGKRDLFMDQKINHGGNTNKKFYPRFESENSVSSFENSLLACFSGREILLQPQKFPPSTNCTSIEYLEKGSTLINMVTTHNVTSDGYYYYIFYSDNDDVENDIHAIFDIHKPTYLYAGIPESKGCYNSTKCSFPIHFLSSERVIVEVPTRDGIESEADDITMLVSTCQPRMAVYIIFPIAVLFLILTCAFL